MAAKRLRPDEKLLDIRAAEQVEGYEVRSHGTKAPPRREVLADPEPPVYTERVRGEHGEVRFSPVVEAVMARLRTRKKEGDGPRD